MNEGRHRPDFFDLEILSRLLTKLTYLFKWGMSNTYFVSHTVQDKGVFICNRIKKGEKKMSLVKAKKDQRRLILFTAE